MSDSAKDSVPPCFDCKNRATERLVEMFVQMGQERRIRLGQRPAERAVFRKLHGVAYGEFEIMKDLPAAMRVGIFRHERLNAWLRFSSDTSPMSPDLGSTLGIGINLFGVPGPNALGEVGDTADFVLQNFPIFFVNNAEEMCEFTYAGVVKGDYPGYLAAHPATSAVLDRMQKPEGSVLTTTYWAILPFRLGPELVKYRLVPELPPQMCPTTRRTIWPSIWPIVSRARSIGFDSWSNGARTHKRCRSIRQWWSGPNQRVRSSGSPR